jgi:tetratricopeptide (TPR) repeat protein
MTTQSDAEKLAEDGKSAFQAGRYESAVASFNAAAQNYALLGDRVSEAEQRNNVSVALLKMRRPQEALEAARGTDEVFAGAGDIRRQGMAFNNQAAALDSLGRWDEALAAYERSAGLLAVAGDGELRSLALKAAAAMQFRRGKIAESGVRMIGVLEARDRPSAFERILKFLLRVLSR